MRCCVYACLLLAANLNIPDPDDGITPLLGVWCLTATADVKHTDHGSDACTMAIGPDGRVVLRMGDLVTNEGTIQVRRAGRLRCIDLALASGQVRGVYEMHGTALTICCAAAGKPRPAGMSPGGTQWLEHWKRVTP